MFEQYYNQLMPLKKVDIIKQGAAWGVINVGDPASDWRLKWTKMQLARFMADRKVRGYGRPNSD